MELFDNHAHYDDEKFDIDRDEVINNIYNAGVTRIISAGYSLESSEKAIELARKYDFIYATCGISPNDIPENEDIFNKQIQDLEKLIQSNNKVVAIGEIGLDYYWNKENKELQRACFIKQIELANKYNLPIVIHTREAIADTLDILKNCALPEKRGVFHCCPLNPELIKEALNLDFYISFCGPVTFKNSKNAEIVANMVPLDKMLIETDSPYLAPEPVRGTRNDSRNVRFIAEKIANYRNVDVKEIAEATYKNANNIYNIR